MFKKRFPNSVIHVWNGAKELRTKFKIHHIPIDIQLHILIDFKHSQCGTLGGI